METFEVYVKENEARCKKTHAVIKPHYEAEYLIRMRKNQADEYKLKEVDCSESWLKVQRVGDDFKLTVNTDKRGVAKFSVHVESRTKENWGPEPLDPIVVND